MCDYMYFSENYGFSDEPYIDSMKIPKKYYDELMRCQADGGYINIVNGYPTIVMEDLSDQHYHEMITCRNNKLLLSDWTQLSDIPENISIPYRKYRQELRDITKQSGFPRYINWPIEPIIKKDP